MYVSKWRRDTEETPSAHLRQMSRQVLVECSPYGKIRAKLDIGGRVVVSYRKGSHLEGVRYRVAWFEVDPDYE